MTVLTFLLRAAIVAALALSAAAVQTAQAQSAYSPVTKYDPKRDADGDIRDAITEAKRSHRRILLEVGGEWCSWCHHLDDFFDSHPDLTKLRDENFVTVKINFSEENRNKEVLSRYSPISAYPHIIVLDADGKELHSQDTGVFEQGKSYALERWMTFLGNWAPPRSDP